jgi:hypothetical protein
MSRLKMAESIAAAAGIPVGRAVCQQSVAIDSENRAGD